MTFKNIFEEKAKGLLTKKITREEALPLCFALFVVTILFVVLIQTIINFVVY